VPSSAEPDRGAWLAVAAALALGAVLVEAAGPALAARLDWQPGLAAREPWRTFSAAWVHLSGLHLAANLAGAALVAALGFVARLPRRTALAWLLAWPLTQLGLLAQPELVRYGGLSGVLHAGVAAAALHLLVVARGPRRLIGGAILAGLVLKVLSEAPLGPALRHPAGWDIAVAPFAHASGVIAGLVASALAETVARRPTRIGPDG
jgi:rhomboid family GlyGly-CTERM serine protease